MQARYGLDRRPVGRWIGVGVIVVLFILILLFVAHGLVGSTDPTRLIQWKVVGPDRVDITFQASTDPQQDVTCVLRAQDSKRIDLGYAVVTIPATSEKDVVISTYPLRTLAPAYTAELLGCEVGGRPRVPGPQFPPGVVPPDQPYPTTG
jgi:hypothetical protein